MEYWDPSASYCDTVLGQGLRISIQQHFVNLASRDTQSFRHPFMASQLNSHYSPTLLSFSIQTQSLSGSVHPKGLSRGTFVKGAHSNLDSHHGDCQDPSDHGETGRGNVECRVKLSSNSNTTTINSGQVDAQQQTAIRGFSYL